MNLIYLVSNLRQAGPTNQGLNIVTSFDKENVNPVVVTLFEEGEKSWMNKYKDYNVHVIQLHGNRRNPIKTRRKLQQLVNELNPDVIHSSGFSADIQNHFIGGEILHLTTYRNHISDVGEFKNALVKIIARRIAKWYLKRLDVIVGCSKAIQKSLIEDLGRDVQCVQNGVDTDIYKPCSDAQKLELRRIHNIPQESTIVITSGKLSKRKDVGIIIDAIQSINKSNILFLILGEGPCESELQQKAFGCDNIIFLGHHSDVKDYYQLSDVFVSASHAEGLPNSVLEAMACGLPCVLSDIDSHEEILEYDREAGRLFKTGNGDDLVSKLNEVLSLNLKDMSKHANDLVMSNLSKYQVSAKYYELYKKFAKR